MSRVPADDLRFLADAMLGRLARWLRAVGFDTAADGGRSDRELVRSAAAEGRVLLTRDRRLIEELRPAAAVLVTADAPLEQLRQVVAECRLPTPEASFTRCLVCNGPLRVAAPAEVVDLIPLRSREAPGPVRRCPDCDRIYWEGSHTRRMRAALDAAFGGRA